MGTITMNTITAIDVITKQHYENFVESLEKEIQLYKKSLKIVNDEVSVDQAERIISEFSETKKYFLFPDNTSETLGFTLCELDSCVRENFSENEIDSQEYMYWLCFIYYATTGHVFSFDYLTKHYFYN